MPAYLLSKGLDPILGVFTGILAFYLHETHPRTGRREDERLIELVRWKYRKNQAEKQKEISSTESGL